MPKLAKKWLKFIDTERGRLDYVEKEFAKLQKAIDAYRVAMKSRIRSAELKGEYVGEHSAQVSNSHQTEVDNLRQAAGDFSVKMGFASADQMSVAIGEAINAVLDKAESGAIL